jgi:hypothetical protein
VLPLACCLLPHLNKQFKYAGSLLCLVMASLTVV